MKKCLLKLLAVCSLTLLSGLAFAQTAPNLNYPSSSYTFAAGFPVPTPLPAPTAAGGGTVPATIYGTVTLFAGNTGGTAGNAGTGSPVGTASFFRSPAALVEDASGTMYVADQLNHCIRQITTAGTVTVLAGSTNATTGTAATGVGAIGTAARFNNPDGIAIDATGTNLYIADASNNCIRKIVISTGQVTIFATGLNAPAGLCFITGGVLVCANQGANNIVKISTGGLVSVFAGSTAGTAGYTDNNNPTNARFRAPNDVEVDASGNIYVADYTNNVIRKITTAGVVSTFAGSTAGTAGTTNNTGTAARFKNPTGLAIDGAGNLYVADAGNNEIREITPAGAVTLFAGSATGTTGRANGVGTGASFNAPSDMYIDAADNMDIADYGNNEIRQMALGGYTITPALPANLTFDQTTGTVAGTPTTVATATNYIVNAYNYYGNDNFTLSITIAQPVTLAGTTGPPNVTLSTTTPAVPIAGFSIKTTTNLSFTTLNFTTPGLNVSGPFSNVTLYSGTTNNYGTAVLTPISGTYNTATDVYTFSSAQAINTTTAYFYIKTDYTPPVTSGTFNLNLTGAAVGATNYTNGGATGPTITCTTSVLLGSTTGITTPSTINTDQTVPLVGFSVKTTQLTTFNSFTFTVPAGDITTASGTFSNFLVYSGSGSTYPGTLTPVPGTFNTATNVFTPSTPQAINGTAYYYVKADFVAPVNAGAFQLNLVSANVTTPSTSYTSGGAISGAAYTCNPPITIATATGLTNMAANPLPNSISATNIPIMAFKVTTTQNETFSKFTLTATTTSNNIATYFNTFKLYAGTSTDFNLSSQITTATFAVSGTSLVVTTGSATPQAAVTPKYYFIVPTNYTAPATSATFELDCNSVTTSSPSVNTYTNGANALGTLCYLGPVTYDWAGTVKTGTIYDWTNPANWTISGAAAPSYPGAAGSIKDIVSFGNTAATYTSGHEPTLSTTDPAITVASITFGSNNGNNITLTANNALTVTGDITVQADDNSNGLQTYGLFGLGNGGSNSTGIINVNLTGTGTMTTSNIKILSNDDLWDNNGDAWSEYNETINASLTGTTGLTVLNNVLLTSTYTYGTIIAGIGATDNLYSATFNVSGGTATVNGYLASTNSTFSGHANKATSFFTTTGGTLILTNVAAMPTATTSHGSGGLDIVGKNTIDFTGGGTVSYATNTGAAQTVYTSANINSVTTGPSYYSIAFTGTGAKTLTTNGNLNVAGDFTNSLSNNGTDYVTLTGPTNTVIFNGNGNDQTLNGGVGTGTTFNNVSFTGGNSTKKMATGTFTVISAGTLNMTGTSTTCVLNANGLLTLNSDANSTATVSAFTGSKIIGNVTVQRFVTGGSPTYKARGYRLFSSPTNVNNVINQTTTQAIVDPTFLNNYMLTGGPGSGFDLVTANPLTYLYDDTRASSAYKFYSGKNVGLYSIAGSPAYTVTIYNTNGSVLATPLKVPVGNSFMVYYTGTSSLSNPYPESTTVNCTGVLNQGKIPVWLFNSTGAATQSLVIPGTNATGINQVGNPYASTISLHQLYVDNNLLHAGNISPVFYEFDPTGSLSGTYLSYNSNTYTTSSTNRSSNYIVSGQGFLVQAVGTFPLVFQEGEKVGYPSIISSATSGGALLMDIPTTVSNNDITSQSFAQAAPSSATTNAAPQLTPEQQAQNALVGLHLQLAKDSTVLTQTGIYFSSKWTDLYSVMEDAIDRDGTAPQVFLSSYSTDGKRLSINQLADYTKGKRIKLYTGATASGTYTFSLADILNIDTINYTVFLVDHKMNDSLDMVKYKTYAFNITTADTTTFGANRFTLVIERHALPPYSLISFSGQKVNNGIQLNWKTLNEGNYTNFALQKLGGSNTYASIYATQGTGIGMYSYLDAHPGNGNNTYRLQQTDIDGRVTYSMPVTINYKNNLQNGALTVYPNPAKTIINVSLNTNGPGSSNYIVDIYNTSGTVIDHKIVNTNNWTQDISNYKLGVYVIEIKTSNGNLIGNTKFVKIIN